AAQGSGCVVVLATELTPELVGEGLARDFVRLVQDRRKEMDLAFTDRIEIRLSGGSSRLVESLGQHQSYIAGETLADKIELDAAEATGGSEVELGEEKIRLAIVRAG
ncbi:MAG: DUF5915 domain-containing protein, partial [Pirellulaceae bacterium]|nr:DUF5915 domain-containing protein [Pirellulaceae bacterium]